MHQMSSAVGRIQLKHYDRRIAEIRKAMNYFWDLLEDVPGLQAHRTPTHSDSDMAGWYAPHGLYHPEQVGGLSVTRFAEAVRAEGSQCSPGINKPLHTHELLNSADVYGHDRPTRIAFSDRDLRQPVGTLPISEEIGHRTYSIPWFKHYRPEIIEQHANAFRKVAEHYEELLEGDPGDPPGLGGWHFYQHR
jgi:dTDP-4-amino-4,6-dideoxygalactose transaminase